MNVHVLTDSAGGVLGVYTKEKRAKGAHEQCTRAYGDMFTLTDCVVNEEALPEEDHEPQDEG